MHSLGRRIADSGSRAGATTMRWRSVAAWSPGDGLLRCKRWREGQRLAGFQQGLEAGEDARPALADVATERGARLPRGKLVVGDRQGDDVGAEGADVEDNPGLRSTMGLPMRQSDSMALPLQYCCVNSLLVRAFQTASGVLAMWVV